MGITAFLAEYITAFIGSTGYISVFVLMMMESMIFPVPSEAVMPFAGFLVANGSFNIIATILVSILGSVTGSLVSYYMGYFGGHRFINKYGKYFLLDHEELDYTESLFKKKGQIIVFFGRMIPVVRHFISIPAGIGKMDIKKFLLFTIIGAGIRNAFLVLVGFYLEKNWDTVMKYSEVIDMFVLIILIALIGMFIYRLIKKKKRLKKKDSIPTK